MEIGGYRVEREVGRGGMGAVLLARAPDGRRVALKLLLREGTNERQRRRFAGEVQALLRLRHPNVVPLLDAGEQRGPGEAPGAGRPFLVLEWVEGETLEAKLEREGPLHPRAAAELVRRLALGVAACHAQGVAHRDLKPANVLLRAGDGEPLLIDFGLALDLDRSRSGTRASLAGQVMGTPGYWSPEQARGDLERIGSPSDVWGLGALLFAALTGKPPVGGRDLVELMGALSGPIPAPSALRPGVPATLDALCAACLAFEPGDRPPSTASVAEALGRWLRGPARRDGGRRVMAGVAGGLALLGVAGGVALSGSRRAAPALGAPAAAVTSPVEPADQLGALLESATGHLRRGAPQAAIVELTRAIQLEPEDPRPWRDRGAARYETGDLRGAREDLARALELDPRDPQAQLSLGTVCAGLGDAQGAEAAWAAAIALRPEWAFAHYCRGLGRIQRGAAEQALPDLDRAVALSPHDAEARYVRGMAYEELEDPASALADYDRSLELRPAAAVVLLARAQLLRSGGQVARAEEDCRRALALEPTLVEGWYILGGLCTLQDDYPAAVEAWSQALNLDPGHVESLINRGFARAALRDHQGALADLDRALALSPGNADALANRAMTRRELGDLRGAAADLERYLELVPGDQQARVALEEVRQTPGR